MENGKIYLIIFFITNSCIVILTQIANHNLKSPCPNIFTYNGSILCSDNNKFPCMWCVTINFNVDKITSVKYLEMNLDKNAIVIKQNSTGKIETHGTKSVIYFQNGVNIKPNQPLNYNICVRYLNPAVAPEIKSILINGNTICDVADEDVTEESTMQPPSTENSLNLNNRNFWKIPNQPNKSLASPLLPPSTQCGEKPPKQPQPLIFSGLRTEEGQHPWHAAIYVVDNLQHLNYRCGGTLVSNKYVITAAHCVTDVQRKKQSLSVYFGKYYLSKWNNNGLQAIPVEAIQVHESFNDVNLDNDIAILKLIRAAEYTTYVRPICLRPGTNVLENLVNRYGMVVGWGLNNHLEASDALIMAKLPVISQEKCIASNIPFFRRYLTKKKFCAGYTNGTTVCNGDSGGGMVFPINVTSKSVIWYLRGIVSFSVPSNGLAICDSQHYSVFTDVSKYYKWLENIMS